MGVGVSLLFHHSEIIIIFFFLILSLGETLSHQQNFDPFTIEQGVKMTEVTVQYSYDLCCSLLIGYDFCFFFLFLVELTSLYFF